MDAITEKKLMDTLNAAEASNIAAQRAIDERDEAAVRALVSEALGHTFTVLALATVAGKLDLVQNLTPSAVYFVEVLTALEVSAFDRIAALKCGSSIGAVPPQSDAEKFLDLAIKLLVSKGGL